MAMLGIALQRYAVLKITTLMTWDLMVTTSQVLQSSVSRRHYQGTLYTHAFLVLQESVITNQYAAADSLVKVQKNLVVAVLGEPAGGDDETIWFARVVKAPKNQTNVAPVEVAWFAQKGMTSNRSIILSPSQESNATIELGAVLDKVTVTQLPGKQISVSYTEQHRIAEIGVYLHVASILYSKYRSKEDQRCTTACRRALFVSY